MKIELTHDLIAKKVRDAVSAQDRARLHAQHIIRVRYELFVTMPQLLLTSDEIAFIQPHKADLLLSEDQMAFLAKSEKVIATELRWTYLRNFLNIAFFLGAIISMWALREYRRAERGADQNQELATNLIEISSDIRRIKTVEDLYKLQDRIGELRRTKLTDEQVASWMRTANTDSLLRTLREPHVNSESFAASLRPIVMQGFVVDEKGKGIPNAIIDILGMKVNTEKDGKFILYVLTDPALLPPHFNIAVFSEGYERYSESIEPNTLQNRVYFENEKIVMKRK
jgi:hypothetical protein